MVETTLRRRDGLVSPPSDTPKTPESFSSKERWVFSPQTAQVAHLPLHIFGLFVSCHRPSLLYTLGHTKLEERVVRPRRGNLVTVLLSLIYFVLLLSLTRRTGLPRGRSISMPPDFYSRLCSTSTFLSGAKGDDLRASSVQNGAVNVKRVTSFSPQ